MLTTTTLPCFRKLRCILIVAIISSCIRFSHQKQYQLGLAERNRDYFRRLKPGQELVFVTTTSKPSADSVVFVNNHPVVATMVPFVPSATTPAAEFLKCLATCPTTSEFNPICASNRQLYGNEQKFNCARQCGADIEIVRRGSCEGLFPMARG